MSDYVFYPVTGNGTSAATAYTWNTGTINFDSSADWAAVASYTTLTIGGSVTSGTVPGAGANVGLIAGAIDPVAFGFYKANPSDGDPYIASNIYPVDVLLNSGSVALGNLLLAGFNQYANVLGGDAPVQFPTLDVEGATLTIGGNILATGTVTFPPIAIPFFGDISSASAAGGGTIDLGQGASIDVVGNVAADIDFNFKDGSGNILEIDAASTATPLAFGGTIEGFVPGDTILLPDVPVTADGVATTATFDLTTGVLAISVGDPVTIDVHIPGFASSSGPVTVTPEGDGIEFVTCFLAGTHIAVESGEVPVEQLAVGDRVRTASGQIQRIEWIGVGRVLATPGRRSAATPVIVRKGAMADNVPHRDLRVTKGHSFYLDGVLIPVEFLVNHRSIAWDDRAQEVTIYHVELAAHDILLAEGAPAESYRDDGNRWLFQNANSGWDLPPKAPYAPVHTGGPIVDANWRRLLERAGPRPGLTTTDEPDLHLMVDGRRVDATIRSGNRWVFHLATRPAAVRIVSRVGVPEELGVARDPRPLGVAVRRILVWKGAQLSMLEASAPALVEGFHPFEQDCGLRWTDGDALLPAAIFHAIDAACEIELYVGCTTTYLLSGDESRQMAA